MSMRANALKDICHLETLNALTFSYGSYILFFILVWLPYAHGSLFVFTRCDHIDPCAG